MSKALVSYLKGKTPLTEMSFILPTPSGAMGMMTGREERLKQAWTDLTIKLEALWLDVMDTDEEIYAQAEQVLDNVRSTSPQGCKAAIPHFEALTTILQKAAETDKYGDEKDLHIYASRMSQLCEEIHYICDEFDPDIPRLPGYSFKSKSQWLRKQQADGNGKADLTFVEPGAEVPDDEEAGDDELDQFPQPGDEEEDVGQLPKPGEEEDTEDGEGFPDDESEEDPEEFDVGNDEEQEPDDEQVVEPQEEEPDDTEADTDDVFQQQGTLPKDPGVDNEPDIQPDDDGESDEENDGVKDGKKPKKETHESYLPPETESLVIASFAKARDAVLESSRDFDSEFLEAAQTLRTVMEEYTDVSSAHVELGMVLPGSPPRVDLYVEWASSDCYGFGRLVFEDHRLHVLDSADRLKESIGIDVDDPKLAERVYLALETIYDVDSRRVFHESRVIPALYRLIERRSRGESIPETAIANILQGLRPRVGLHENVRMVSQEISLKLDESFEDIHNYYFSWLVHNPLTHRNLPDEIGNDETVTPDGVMAERKRGALAEHWRTPGIVVSFRDQAVYLVTEDCGRCDGDREVFDPDTTDEDASARLASLAYQKESTVTGRLIEHAQVNRRDVCRMVETVFGSVLHEDTASLTKMSTDELWQLAAEKGLQVNGDPMDRDVLLTTLCPVTESYLTEGINDPYILKAVFYAGGGGSGKSTIARHMFAGVGLKVVNSDDILEALAKNPSLRAKFKELANLRPGQKYDLGKAADMLSPDIQAIIRPKSKVASKGMLSMYLKGRLGLVIDSTGRQVGSIEKTKKMLENDYGYDTYMVFVDVPVETAVKRNQMRDRKVPEDELRKAHAEIRANLSKFKSMFGSNFTTVDTSGAPDEAALRKKGLAMIAGSVKNPAGKEWIEAQKKALEVARTQAQEA